MATAGGPDIIEDGLVLALDAANNKGISPAANEEFNNSDQFVKNLIDRSQSISVNNGVKVGNLNYYTAFGISYPEGNYGGSAASRDGITPGFNVTSGTKTYDCSRDLNMFVFNDDTETRVADSYFNGERANGHCYDTYDGQPSQHATFQADYDNIKATFPNATYIIIGSHAAENNDNDSATLSRLQELGFPDSQIGVGRPEYILVGKPGKNYVYAYENYSTNPGQVAHAVFPLPINKVNKDNCFDFDGTNDYIDAGAVSGDFSNFTVIAWFYPTSVTNHENVLDCNYSNYASTGNVGPRLEMNSSGRLSWIYSNVTDSNNSYYNHPVVNSGLSANTWHCSAITFDGSNSNTYLNGITSGLSRSTVNTPTGFIGSIGEVIIGKGFHLGGSERVYTGRVAQVKIYNRALTASEVLQNYSATKGRFGL